MIAALLLISFSIHVVLSIVVWKLVKEINVMKNNQPENITDVFEGYLKEIKEENRKLKNLSIANKSNQDGMEEQTKTVINDKQRTVVSSNIEPSKNPEMTQVNEQMGTQSDEHDISLSFEAKVLHLYSQGLTIEEIAKKLNSGKTEITLIVKFHDKNKQ